MHFLKDQSNLWIKLRSSWIWRLKILLIYHACLSILSRHFRKTTARGSMLVMCGGTTRWWAAAVRGSSYERLTKEKAKKGKAKAGLCAT